MTSIVPLPRLITIRYVDDMILFAKSLSELESMIEKLMQELRKINLCLNEYI